MPEYPSRRPSKHIVLGEWDQKVREAAGLPPYDMDDPGRPFTPEYEDSPAEPSPTDAPAEVSDSEDTTPSADARELHAVPTTSQLQETRHQYVVDALAPARLALEAAQVQNDADVHEVS